MKEVHSRRSPFEVDLQNRSLSSYALSTELTIFPRKLYTLEDSVRFISGLKQSDDDNY